MDWSLPVALVAASIAVNRLGRSGALLQLAPAGTRTLGEWAGIGSLVAFHVAPIWVGAWILGLGQHAAAGSLAALGSMTLIAVKLTVLGGLMLRVPAPGPVRIAGLWTLAWLLPVSLAGQGWLADLAASWTSLVATESAWPVALGPIVALALASRLLLTPRRAR
jgi:hypothetical protein